ncbi:MAG TPA: nucleotide sugar dehydrogenase, partial [Polyangiaceae bacterium]|nr:nucleotide sugar dehydrogenase [Polyangiaceae bacterium]
AQVVACDVSQAVVDAINQGETLIDEPGVAELVRQAHADKKLRATTDTRAGVAECEVVVVIVPALLTSERDIDASILISVCHTLASALQPGAMVCFETTMPVGGTRRLLLPALESAGRRAGVDFDLVFSPERLKSRHVLERLPLTPKVVGGFDAKAAARAERFYAQYLGAPVMNVGTLEAAEMVKLAGMVYRDVNIALANELSRYAEATGVDIVSLAAAINSDGEAALLQPGLGVGGHCTPVYPYFYIRDAQRLGVDAALAAHGRRINDAQVAHVVDRLERALPLSGRRVTILGLAFRPDVKEHIFSPAFALHEILRTRGAEVMLHDPLYTPAELSELGFTPSDLKSPADALILHTAHSAYRELPFAELAKAGVRAFVDGRAACDGKAVRAAGIAYVGVGRPILES